MKQKQRLTRTLWLFVALFFVGGLILCLPEQAEAAGTTKGVSARWVVQGYINDEEYESYDDYVCTPGKDYTLRVDAAMGATNPDIITYSWEKMNLFTYDEETLDIKDSVLTIKSIAEPYRYKCTVSYGNREEEYYFYLTFGDTLDVQGYINGKKYRSWKDYVCTKGETYKLEMSAESSFKPNGIEYTWYKYDAAEDVYISLEMKGNSIVTEAITEKTVYRCDTGDGNKSHAYYFVLGFGDTLTVQGYVNGKDYKNEEDYIGKFGETYVLSVKASSTYRPNGITYTWYEKDPYWYDEYNQIQTGDTFTVRDMKEDATYYCEVSDGNENEEYCFKIGFGDTLTIATSINGYKRIDYDKNSMFPCEKGQPYTLEVNASTTYGLNGSADISYQWYKVNDYGDYDDYDDYYDGREILEDSTGNKYSIASLDSSAIYLCVVTDGYKSKNCYFNLSLGSTLKVKSYITADGKKVETNTLKRMTGEEAVLSVEAESSLPSGNGITYKWQKDWEEIENETGTTLKVKQEEYNYGDYRCIISDGTTTKTVEFEIYPVYPARTLRVSTMINDMYEDGIFNDAYIPEGTEVTMKVIPNSAYKNPNYTYEWYRRKNDYDSVRLPAFTGPECTVTKGAGIEEYCCELSDGHDSRVASFTLDDVAAFDASTDTRLYVNDVMSAGGRIVQTGYKKGDTVNLKVVTTSDSYQVDHYEWECYNDWYDDDDDEDTSSNMVPDSNNCRVTMHKDYVQYVCRVYWKDNPQYPKGDYMFCYFELGEEEEYEKEEALIKRFINGQEASCCTSSLGDEVTLQVQVPEEFKNKCSYQWYDRNTLLKNQQADTCKITISEDDRFLEGYDYKEYRCKVNLDGKKVETLDFDIYIQTIEVEPYINGRKTIDQSCEYLPGDTVSFQAKVTNYLKDKPVTYEWSIGDEDGRVPIDHNSDTYTSNELKGYQQLWCTVRVGQFTTSLFFEAVPKASLSADQYINNQERETLNLASGSSATLRLDVSSLLKKPEYTYSWYNSHSKKIGDKSSVTVTKASGTEAYWCIASDGNSTEKYLFTLTEKADTKLRVKGYVDNKKADRIQNKKIGDSVTLKVAVQGDDAKGASYQWYVNNQKGYFGKINNTTNELKAKIQDEQDIWLCIVSKGTQQKTMYFATEIESHYHEDEKVSRVEPTCVTPGTTAGTKCSICGKILSGCEPIPATGVHKWDGGKITKAATTTSAGIKTYTCIVCGQKKTQSIPKLNVLKKGTKFTDAKSKAIYKVTGSSTVEYMKPKAAKATVKVPSSVTTSGRKYTVTSIAANAFKNNKKLKSVVIPSGVTKIGKNAFLKCKNLKKITIQSKKLTAKSVGKSAFKEIHAKATVKVPKGKAKAYQKILKAKGLGKKAKVK